MTSNQSEETEYTTEAFGREFTHIPDHVIEDIASLEREGALYSDHWVDELNDFRHVRIPLTPEEIKEYVRRTWAYELFMRAGRPKWAKDTPGIDADVAEDADTYSFMGRDGTEVLPPYHCFAAFLGSHLEAVSCGMVSGRSIIIELQGKESALFTLSRAIQALTPTIRSFNTREKGLQAWPISREDDIRDLLYVMLKPVLFDLVKEEPVPSLAGTHKFVDLCSKASRILIEVKWIGQRGRWKTILNQIQVDIQSYPSHDCCETIVFVVVDAARDLPDPRLFEAEISGPHMVRERPVDIKVYVVEP